MRRIVIFGRGGVGKSALSRRLSAVTGIPAVELDPLFWQPGPAPMDPSRWAACQQELVQPDRWILDADLGPYDTALAVRLQAADTIVSWAFPSGDAPGGRCAEAMSKRNTGAG
jgi:adenylate kinase family enzyme